MLERLTTATFAPLVGQVFRAVPAQGDPLDLVLSSCEEAGFAVPAGLGAVDRTPFSLLFHAADGRHAPQQIFTVQHPELGELPLFLVPLGPDERGMRYEAVIS